MKKERNHDHPLEVKIQTKYGSRIVTGLLASYAKKGGEDLEYVVREVEKQFEKEKEE